MKCQDWRSIYLFGGYDVLSVVSVRSTVFSVIMDVVQRKPNILEEQISSISMDEEYTA
jgi:hypothetical protein